ncbi:hypothetical protein ACNKHU_17610 [Shigella flexneri]
MVYNKCGNNNRWNGCVSEPEEEVLNHLFANEVFNRYYRQTLLAVKNNTLSPRTGLRQLSEFIQTR